MQKSDRIHLLNSIIKTIIELSCTEDSKLTSYDSHTKHWFELMSDPC